MTKQSSSATEGGFLSESKAGGWKVVVASLVGVTLGLSALPFYTLGVFAGPIADEFGWSRADVQSGLLFSMIATVAFAGVTGWMIDRFGARAVALGAQVGLAVGLLLLAAQPGPAWVWKASWLVMAALSLGTTPLTWSRGIADWFAKARGKALGIALSGSGITAVIAPPVAMFAVDAVGWRMAYVIIAAMVVLIALPCTWFLFHTRKELSGVMETASRPETGYSFGEVLRGYRFWLMLAAFSGVSFAIGGAIPNLVPMLNEAGVADAALYASLLGAMVIVGRIVSGILLDHFWGPAVAVALLAIPALSCLLLAWGLSPGAAAALIGLAGGAEFDLVAFLSARYFGMRSFGRAYSWQWAGFALATGIGSTAFAAVRDYTGSYDPALYMASALMALGGLSLLALGKYPQFDNMEQD